MNRIYFFAVPLVLAACSDQGVSTEPTSTSEEGLIARCPLSTDTASLADQDEVLFVSALTTSDYCRQVYEATVTGTSDKDIEIEVPQQLWPSSTGDCSNQVIELAWKRFDYMTGRWQTIGSKACTANALGGPDAGTAGSAGSWSQQYCLASCSASIVDYPRGSLRIETAAYEGTRSNGHRVRLIVRR